MLPIRYRWTLSVVVVAGSLTVGGLWGCNGSQPPEPLAGATAGDDHTGDDHAGHDHDGHGHSDHDHATPETFAQAVDQLNKIGQQLAAAYQEGKGPEADHAMHEMLDAIHLAGKLVTQANLDRYDQADVTAAIAQLTGIITEDLHGAMKGHGSTAEVKAEDYDKVASPLQEALAKLTRIAQKSAAAPAGDGNNG